MSKAIEPEKDATIPKMVITFYENEDKELIIGIRQNFEVDIRFENLTKLFLKIDIHQ